MTDTLTVSTLPIPRIPATLCLLLVAGIGAISAQPPTKGLDLKLISELSAIQPGKKFTVGLHIHHHDGFHTYWQNPGIVGLATELEWSLPPGFTAGPIQWPTPEIVDMAGHPAHGFHRDVLLMVDITPPGKIAEKEVTLQAAATWMACAKSCHPGTTTLQLTLPVATSVTTPPDQRALFDAARKDIPQPLQACPVELITQPDAPTIRLRFTPSIPLPGEPASVYFFSTDGQVSSDQPQKLTPLDNSFLLILQRSEFSPKQATSLPGVLRLSTEPDAAAQAIGTINPAFPDKSAAPTP